MAAFGLQLRDAYVDQCTCGPVYMWTSVHVGACRVVLHASDTHTARCPALQVPGTGTDMVLLSICTDHTSAWKCLLMGSLYTGCAHDACSTGSTGQSAHGALPALQQVADDACTAILCTNMLLAITVVEWPAVVHIHVTSACGIRSV